MLPFCRSSIAIALLAAAGVLMQDARGRAQPFGLLATGRSFELSDTVQLDRVDQTVLAQLERVKACLADRQWDEAVDALRRLARSSRPNNASAIATSGLMESAGRQLAAETSRAAMKAGRAQSPPGALATEYHRLCPACFEPASASKRPVRS